MSDATTAQAHAVLVAHDAERDDARAAALARVSQVLPDGTAQKLAETRDAGFIRDEVKRRALIASMAGLKSEQLLAVKRQVPAEFAAREKDGTRPPPIRNQDVAAHRAAKAANNAG